MANPTQTRGFHHTDAVQIASEWAVECEQIQMEKNSAGTWIELFTDEFKRAFEMSDDEMSKYSDYDVLQYWRTLLDEAISYCDGEKK
jgi:hypothetical protein